jgi:hypothetical protein
MDVEAFIERWRPSEAGERANKDSFLKELCRVLGVPEPKPATGDVGVDDYVFEADARLRDEEGRPSIGKMDLYRRGSFILEAKQGSTARGKKTGTARRDTPGWHVAMSDAFGQALKYARTLDDPPPFLIGCDIGYCFDIYACFDGSGIYRPFPNAQKHRRYLRSLGEDADTLRAIWLDPCSLDPQRHAERITRDLAESLAGLAVELEKEGHEPHLVAKFLMRCLFTMFAEDIGLLSEKLFTQSLEKRWLPEPATFVDGVEELWDAMNAGKRFWILGKLLHFNGGLFADPVALPLTHKQLTLLHKAALRDWADVEPSIFGTLLERALDPQERSRLGAHFTPRAYVERLLVPTIEEPLRAQWELILGQVRKLVPPNEVAKPRTVRDALALVRSFHKDLCATNVLDPACGSGNFLYVALDIFKRIESDVLRLCEDLGDSQRSIEPEQFVTPKQFLGIEIRPWAKEIAELVLWIGYLQWHHKTYGQTRKPPEPVMKNHLNIQCRDALLIHDGRRVVVGKDGKPVTRWDQKTMKVHPVTWKEIPDEDARIGVEELVNPRPASAWPEAEYIVGNPPFVGNKRMRQVLGDEYVEGLRAVHDDVPDTADYVMYWWNHAAKLLAKKEIERFGFITTKSITQSFNSQVVSKALTKTKDMRVAFAIPNHPWVDSADGAAVRIAMTVVDCDAGPGTLGRVVREATGSDGSADVTIEFRTGTIRSDLAVGASVPESVQPLIANHNMCLQGCKLVQERGEPGFCLTPDERAKLLAARPEAKNFIPRYFTGNDLTKAPVERYVIDFYGLSEDEARAEFPEGFQLLVDRVKPFREQNRRETRAKNWWLFGENAPKLRRATASLRRFIATSEVAKNRVFVFLPLPGTLADGSLAAIADDDAFVLGVLSSTPHLVWALVRGGRMGKGDDPRYQNGPCFDPFPFPDCDEGTKADIRAVAEKLDAHRKKQLAAHPKLQITTMYNVLDKLRRGQPLTIQEHAIHHDGLVAVLKSFHDDLDALVIRAYGWSEVPSDAEIMARLRALNASRALEEGRGIIQWLREDYQRRVLAAKVSGIKRSEAEVAASTLPLPWPREFPEQVALVRDFMLNEVASVTANDVASRFDGATAKTVEPALETLTALGIVAVYATDSGRRWKGLTKTMGSSPPPTMTGTYGSPPSDMRNVAEKSSEPPSKK